MSDFTPVSTLTLVAGGAAIGAIAGMCLATAVAKAKSREITRYPFEETHRLHKCFGKAVVYNGSVF